jgi:hemolysin activation/secretion protein
LQLDSRDVKAAPQKGVLVWVTGRYFPEVWDVKSAFGSINGEASTYLTAPGPVRPTLALRAGGKRVFGTYPFHEAAFIGGSNTVRGFRAQRFAGDGSVYGNAELRLRLGRFYLVLPGEFGVFGLADAGRVYVEGESSDRWHTAVGGGLWFAYLDRSRTVTIAVASSKERTGLYVRAGFIF